MALPTCFPTRTSVSPPCCVGLKSKLVFPVSLPTSALHSPASFADTSLVQSQSHDQVRHHVGGDATRLWTQGGGVPKQQIVLIPHESIFSRITSRIRPRVWGFGDRQPATPFVPFDSSAFYRFLYLSDTCPLFLTSFEVSNTDSLTL